MRGKRRELALAIRMICVAALLFLGFAHRAPVPQVQDPLALAFHLPDGSAPDLCIPAPVHPGKFTSSDCEACRLSAGVVLPTPPAVALYLDVSSSTVFLALRQAAPPTIPRRAQTARGPPAILLS